MSSHAIRRIQVSSGRLAINDSEIRMPIIGVNGTQGVLNGLFRSGRLLRNTHTPAQTMTNASSVPMLTNWPRTLIGKRPEKVATSNPTTIDEIHGVRNRGWIALAQGGNNPSRDIA